MDDNRIPPLHLLWELGQLLIPDRSHLITVTGTLERRCAPRRCAGGGQQLLFEGGGGEIRWLIRPQEGEHSLSCIILTGVLQEPFKGVMVSANKNPLMHCPGIVAVIWACWCLVIVITVRILRRPRRFMYDITMLYVRFAMLYVRLWCFMYESDRVFAE